MYNRFINLPIELVVSIKYRFSVDSFRYATKRLKQKAKNHNSKLKTFSRNSFVFTSLSFHFCYIVYEIGKMKFDR
ncbi:hypothetical protein ES703_17027 [subsurface metagenome]